MSDDLQGYWFCSFVPVCESAPLRHGIKYLFFFFFFRFFVGGKGGAGGHSNFLPGVGSEATEGRRWGNFGGKRDVGSCVPARAGLQPLESGHARAIQAPGGDERRFIDS